MKLTEMFECIKKYGYIVDADFDESKVKRDSNGQFAKQNEESESEVEGISDS